MALGTTRTLNVQQTNTERTAPCSVVSQWTQAIDTTITLDNASPTNPTTQITASTRHIVSDDGRGGTFLVPSVRWDATQTHTTSPIFAAFGRTADDLWVRLRTRAGALTWTPTFTDYSADATYRRTVPNLDTDPFDRMGCQEVLFCTTQAAVLDPVEGVGSFLDVKPL